MKITCLGVTPSKEEHIFSWLANISNSSKDDGTNRFLEAINSKKLDILSHVNIVINVNQDVYFEKQAPGKLLVAKSLGWLSTDLRKRDEFLIKRIKGTYECFISGSLKSWIELLGCCMSNNLVHQVFKEAYPEIHRLTFGDRFSNFVKLDETILVRPCQMQEQVDLYTERGWDIPFVTFMMDDVPITKRVGIEQKGMFNIVNGWKYVAQNDSYPEVTKALTALGIWR